MTTTEQIECISYIDNRSTNQTKQLFKLCGYSIEKLLKVLAILKKYHIFGCPSDVETINNLIKK